MSAVLRRAESGTPTNPDFCWISAERSEAVVYHSGSLATPLTEKSVPPADFRDLPQTRLEDDRGIPVRIAANHTENKQ